MTNTSENCGYVPPQLTEMDVHLSKAACTGMSGISGTSEEYVVGEYEFK